LKIDLYSPFQLDLGTVNFGLTYNSVYLGQGTGTNTKIVCRFSLFVSCTALTHISRLLVQTTSLSAVF
jgi:hypothetical protein